MYGLNSTWVRGAGSAANSVVTPRIDAQTPMRIDRDGGVSISGSF